MSSIATSGPRLVSPTGMADGDVARSRPGRPRTPRGDFAARTGFTYSVLDGDEVVRVRLSVPTNDGEHDVEAQSWVRASRAELDVVLWRRLSAWLAEAWPFQRPLYEPRR